MFAAFTFASLNLFLTCRAGTNIYLVPEPNGSVHELSDTETTQKICAYGRADGKDVFECSIGKASYGESGTPKVTFSEDLDSWRPVYLVIIPGHRARFWLNKITVHRGDMWSKTSYGDYDTHGWCLSADPCNIVGWESFADKCGKVIKLSPRGTVEYVDDPATSLYPSATDYSFTNIDNEGTTNQEDTCVPYQIPLASADDWCSHAGAIHQDVPGCGRVCSDDTKRGVKNKGIWKPKSEVSCDECPAARWPGCTVPYQIPLSPTTTGDYWCNHEGAIHQDVPECGRVCSDTTNRGVKNKGIWKPKSQVPCSECYAANWPGCQGAKERDEKAAQQSFLTNAFDQLTGGGFGDVFSFLGRRRLVEEEEEATTTVPLDSTAALRLLEAEA